MARTIEQWEAFLKPYFGQVRTLGEIPVTRQDCDELGRLLHEQICLHGSNQATTLFCRKYPCTFAVYLVAMGVHYYDSGDYWTAVMSATRVDYNEKNRWGPTFLQILEGFGLEKFEKIKGHVYVTPILAHGGIPVYSLPDFFRNALMPSVQKPQFRDLNAKDVILVILNRAVVQLFTDKPVQRFLRNGGERAEQFVAECRKMARHYLQHQEMPLASEVDLPGYVLRAFQTFIEEDQAARSDQRLRRPQIVLSPGEPNFYIVLPAEPVDGKRMEHGGLFWRVADAGDGNEILFEEHVRVRHPGSVYQTEEKTEPLDEVCALQVSFMQRLEEEQEEVIRSWRLQLAPAPGDVPLLAFDAATGRMIVWNQVLPNRALHLVFPKDISIELDGGGQLLETCPSFWGEWVDWQVETWDLSEAYALRLVQEEQTLFAPVPVQVELLAPHLESGQQLPGVWDPDKTPFYVGKAPMLRLPRRPGMTAEQDAADWTIAYQIPHPAFPQSLPGERRLQADKLQVQEDHMLYPLSAELGDSPCGTFHLVVTDPDETRTELAFRIWPQLEVAGLPEYVLPGKNGAEALSFDVKTAPGTVLAVQDGAGGVSLEKKETHSNTYTVRVDANTSLAEMVLLHSKEDHERIWVPLSLAVPRLRWRLQLRDGMEQPPVDGWRSSPDKYAMDALLQSTQPAVLLELANADDLPLQFEMGLINAENDELLQLGKGKQFAKLHQMHWRFELNAFKDTVREYKDLSVMAVRLHVADEKKDQEIEIDLAWLTRDLDITDVRLEPMDEMTFRLRWHEEAPLRNRRVRIWSLWQPWSKPIEIRVADEAREEFVCKEVGLPAGEYKLSFFVAAPWDTAAPPILPPEEGVHISLGDPRERLDRINECMQRQPERGFMLQFEKACILTQLEGKDSKEADQAIQWCIRNFDLVPPRNILVLHDWLGRVNEYSQKAARMRMFKPDILERILETPENETYLELFKAVKSPNSDSVWLLLLHAQDPGLKFHCLRLLIQIEDKQVVSYLVQLLGEGELAMEDVIDLMAGKEEFISAILKNQPSSRAREILLDAALAKFPAGETVVTVGYWVRSDAGWGCIEKIWDSEWHFERQSFDHKVNKPILSVTLRGEEAPEPIEIYVLENMIQFVREEQVYLCTFRGCEHFMSSDVEKLKKEHGKIAHHGKVDQVKKVIFPYAMKHELCFRPTQPKYDAIWD